MGEVLLLYDAPPKCAQAVMDHVDALRALPGARVWACRVLGDLPPWLDLDRFDWVVIHYTLVVSHRFYLTPGARRRLAKAHARKAVFVQDEYRHVYRTIAALEELGCSVVFTCCPEPERVYGKRFGYVRVLTGYVPPRLVGRKCPGWSERLVDIGYRGRSLPFELGRLAQEKRWIGEVVGPVARAEGMTVDISSDESARLYGTRWERFLMGCRWTLGTESGASVFDWSGAVKEFADGCESWEEFVALAGPGLGDGAIPMGQVSPRCFEAAALRCGMILYDGGYSGVLVPGRHYLALRKDHSNLGEVLEMARSEEVWRGMVDRAYHEVVMDGRWRYGAMAQVVGKALAGHGGAQGYGWVGFALARWPGLAVLAKRAFRWWVVQGLVGYGVARVVHRWLPGVRWRRRVMGYQG